MKTLSSHQQQELQELLTKVCDVHNINNEDIAQLTYWAIELKPKRVRKKEYLPVDETVQTC